MKGFVSPIALTIAGVDSCGGAGVATDLKTFNTLCVHGACVITALTAQNTRGIFNIISVKPKFVEFQVKTLLKDIKITVAKTGVLYTAGIVDTVAKCVENYKLSLVVDPVFQASSGFNLASLITIKAYKRRLLPLAMLVTPNIFEAEKLTGMKVKNLESVKLAAKKIVDLGVKAVMVKGGHLKGREVIDVFFHDGEFTLFTKPKVATFLHGGGCAFSAAITAQIAKGLDLHYAVEKAEDFIKDIFSFPLKIGKGRAIVNPTALLWNNSEKYYVMDNVASSQKKIIDDRRFLPFIAEVGTQIAQALYFATAPQHIAAIENRIRRICGELKSSGIVKFGVSSHMARLILSCMKYYPKVRAAMNLHYDRSLIKAFYNVGMTVESFDRRLEPKSIKISEGLSLGWGLEQVIMKKGKIPDVIFDLGEEGKEPMIRIIGETALEVVEKVQRAFDTLKIS